jgi:hypothetical protein
MAEREGGGSREETEDSIENLGGSLGRSIGDTKFWGVTVVVSLSGVDCFLRNGILSLVVDGVGLAVFDGFDDEEAGG